MTLCLRQLRGSHGQLPYTFFATYGKVPAAGVESFDVARHKQTMRDYTFLQLVRMTSDVRKMRRCPEGDLARVVTVLGWTMVEIVMTFGPFP